MATEWCSEENLRIAWRYVKRDIRDDFVFDVINHADVEDNLEHVIKILSAQLRNNQYHPAPLLRIGVPKNDHSSRPGTSISIVDLIVLYAIAQRLAPQLDHFLCDSVYSFRLNPKAQMSGEPLFKDRPDVEVQEGFEPGLEPAESDFPYDWFSSWKQFNNASINASKEYKFAAVTDITAYFEDISLNILREQLKERLDPEYRGLIDRLFRLLEFWDWSPTRNLPHRIGLPQGNDVSSFLSNLYLIDLDLAMLDIVKGDTSKYHRYVDDIKIFTSDYDEACKSLVRLEKGLRALNLNVQSAKTEIKTAESLFDPLIETWLQSMDRADPNRIANAKRFFEEVAEPGQLASNPDGLSKWQRPYARSLTLLRDAGDDRAIDGALTLFLINPANKLLTKHFTYLRHFVTCRGYSMNIAERLASDRFTFFYHRAFMYRLAAYSRDDCPSIKEIALEEISNGHHWFCKMAALFCLHTFALDPQDLDRVGKLIDSVERPEVIRAAFIVLLQYGGEALSSIVEKASLFSAPSQEYLRRYFLKLYQAQSTEIGRLGLRQISVNAPTFIHNLHKMDLLKASSNSTHRSAFITLIDSKIQDCKQTDWSRLSRRLLQVRDVFISSPPT
jgi:hypothetical protein